MATKLVKVQATKTAVTTVRGERLRQNIVTNTDKKAEEAAEKEGGSNAHTFFVSGDIAQQLVDKGVVKIVGDGSDAPTKRAEPVMGSTVTHEAGKRLEENADADQEGASVSGADTRDTTAFARPPLQSGETAPGGEGEEAADADAAPTESADDADASAAATRTRTRAPRRRSGGRGKAAGESSGS